MTKRGPKILKVIKKGKGVYHYIVLSKSIPKKGKAPKRYTVVVDHKKVKSCSCMGWINSGGPAHNFLRIRCAHIEYVAKAV